MFIGLKAAQGPQSDVIGLGLGVVDLFKALLEETLALQEGQEIFLVECTTQAEGMRLAGRKVVLATQAVQLPPCVDQVQKELKLGLLLNRDLGGETPGRTAGVTVTGVSIWVRKVVHFVSQVTS